MKTGHPKHHKSHTGFVLINGQSKKEQPVGWQWLTQKQIRMSQTHQQQHIHPRLSYNDKKRILTSLQDRPPTSCSFKIRSGFSLNERKRVISTASAVSLRTDKQIQPFIYLNSNQEQLAIPALNFGINADQLSRLQELSQQKGTNVLGVVSIRSVGLRFRFNHCFVQYCPCFKSDHCHDLKEISQEIKGSMSQYAKQQKQLYFYSIDGSPLHGYKDISKIKLKVIVVNHSPRWQFGEQIGSKIKELGMKFYDVLSKYQQKNQVTKHSRNMSSHQYAQDYSEDIDEYKYDHQRIKNVKEYVDIISDDPAYKLTEHVEPPNQLLSWYQQKFTSNEPPQKERSKNLLFETKNHYPKEIVNRKLLAKASDKVGELKKTNNSHKYIPLRVELMMEQVRRQTPQQKPKKDYKFEAPVTKKDMLAQLDRKNTLLTTQNIPYLIEKYGLNRFQLYNLYNLYKSFEKIAVMRSPSIETVNTVKKKGIDRETFEVGLKGLDMNPGDELIKGICYFGDFICWEQFIKIISISLRKTPEEKLTAILKGISSFDTGFLSKHQISLMIGNSLQKLFDHEQCELRDYFTQMAMGEFDPQGTGRVSVEVMKEKVLTKGSQNMNMVSFLILNT